MEDQIVNITPEVLQQLTSLRAEPKFHAKDLYPGAPNEAIRLDAERVVNAMLDCLNERSANALRKSYILALFLEMLKYFDSADTEEREQACYYCELVMSILHIESSDGALNKWLYDSGPDSRT
jgi:hypothetical protein